MSTSHGGGQGFSLRSVWTIGWAGCSSGQRRSRTLTSNSCFYHFHQRNVFLKYKKGWLRLTGYKVLSTAAKILNNLAGNYFSLLKRWQMWGGIIIKYFIRRLIYTIRMKNGWFVCTCILSLHWCKCASLQLRDHINDLAPGRGLSYLFPVEWQQNVFLLSIKCGE